MSLPLPTFSPSITELHKNRAEKNRGNLWPNPLILRGKLRPREVMRLACPMVTQPVLDCLTRKELLETNIAAHIY